MSRRDPKRERVSQILRRSALADAGGKEHQT